MPPQGEQVINDVEVVLGKSSWAASARASSWVMRRNATSRGWLAYRLARMRPTHIRSCRPGAAWRGRRVPHRCGKGRAAICRATASRTTSDTVASFWNARSRTAATTPRLLPSR